MNETSKPSPLQSVLIQRATAYSQAIDRLRENGLNEEPDAVSDAIQDLREAVELTRCLRRLLDGRTVREIHAAFGAPGDFGYETALGAALDRTYRGETKEER